MPSTSAGFQGNGWPQITPFSPFSWANAASENRIVTAFQLPSPGSENTSPHSSPHLSTPRIDSSHAPPSSICVEMRITTLARTIVEFPGIAIAQNEMPAYPVRSYGTRGAVVVAPASGTALLKSAPTPAPQVAQAFQLACSARPPLGPAGGTAGELG